MSRRPVGSAGEVLISGLFEEHGAALVAYASRLTGDRAGGESVVRETLLRAWSDPRSTADAGTARAHLFAVVRRVVAERRGEVAEDGPVVDSTAVLGAVRTLPPEQREVLLAVYFQGRDVSSTAAELGVSEATVKVRVSSALRRLRDVLGGSPVPLVLAEEAGP
ncbi:sigma factor-like helix-turn-helix DNA-binding protein [Actinoplanes sp. NPDC051343]|uniref:sigma factor-like helix-turn-helix DNA-binding protein n=1 Tax=Actinoplanes sp. NPDC051343 TaxID=3363906 RepID=UPI0037B7B4E9